MMIMTMMMMMMTMMMMMMMIWIRPHLAQPPMWGVQLEATTRDALTSSPLLIIIIIIIIIIVIIMVIVIIIIVIIVITIIIRRANFGGEWHLIWYVYRIMHQMYVFQYAFQVQQYAFHIRRSNMHPFHRISPNKFFIFCSTLSLPPWLWPQWRKAFSFWFQQQV